MITMDKNKHGDKQSNAKKRIKVILIENENHPKTGFRSANHLASSPPHFSPLSAPLSLLPFFSLPDLAAQREHESTRLAGEV
jgi:hypothetical protein